MGSDVVVFIEIFLPVVSCGRHTVSGHCDALGFSAMTAPTVGVCSADEGLLCSSPGGDVGRALLRPLLDARILKLICVFTMH